MKLHFTLKERHTLILLVLLEAEKTTFRELQVAMDALADGTRTLSDVVRAIVNLMPLADSFKQSQLHSEGLIRYASPELEADLAALEVIGLVELSGVPQVHSVTRYTDVGKARVVTL